MSLLLSSRLARGSVRALEHRFLTYFPDWLSVATTKKTWISQQMEAEMNPVFNYVSLLGRSPLTLAGAPLLHLELL
jgi:hypothetical protein